MSLSKTKKPRPLHPAQAPAKLYTQTETFSADAERSARIRERLLKYDPSGYGLLNPKSFEPDDLYDIIVPANAGKGRTEAMTCRVAPEMKVAADLVVAQRWTPFQTPSEMLRAGLLLMLRIVSESNRASNVYRKAVKLITLATMQDQMERKAGDLAKFLGGAEEKMRGLKEKGQIRTAYTLLLRMEDLLVGDDMDDADWRDQIAEWSERMRTEMFPDGSRTQS